MIDAGKVHLAGFCPPLPGGGRPTQGEFVAYLISGGSTLVEALEMGRMAFVGLRGSDSLLAWAVAQEVLAMMQERAR